MQCNSCDESISEDSVFCPHCGALQKDTTKHKSKNRKPFIAVITTIIIIALSITGYYSYRAYDNNKTMKILYPFVKATSTYSK